MPSLYTEIEINAPRTVVWRTLLRKQDWMYWNTFLYDRTPNRSFRQGEKILLSLKRLTSEDETEIEPLVTLLQPEFCLRWVYTAPGFRSEHIFELQDMGANRTKYIHQEILSGLMVRFFLPFIRKDEQQGLRRMAWEMKQYVEGGHF
jgi:hypothetical protein